MTGRIVRIGLLLLLLLALARPAAAASPPPVAGDVAAKLQLARQLFQEEKYREAAEAMLAAYALDAKPLYLFNAAQAYRKAQLYKEALAQYRAYIERGGNGPLANEAQGHMQDMEALLKEQANRQEVHMLLESEQAEKKKTQEQLEAEQRKAREMEQALKKERNKPFYKKTWFHGLVGAGASVLVVGGLVGLAIGGASRTDAGTRPITFSGQ